jgi:ATP-dependent DNA ligase
VIGYQTGMLRPVWFIEPCLPTGARSVPSGPQWAYEIKHDGFRFICWRAGDRVRVFSRQVPMHQTKQTRPSKVKRTRA